MSNIIHWTEDSILGALRNFMDFNGRPPLMEECLKSNGLPDGTTITRKFGTFNKALDRLKYPRNKNRNYNKQEALDALRKFASILERRPRGVDLDESVFVWLPNRQVYDHLFGSLTKALILIGFVPYSPRGLRKYSDDDVLLFMQYLAIRLGHVLREHDLRIRIATDCPSGSTCTKRFGSWSNAIAKAFPDGKIVKVSFAWLPMRAFLFVHRLMRRFEN